jgi:hypothetical protein
VADSHENLQQASALPTIAPQRLAVSPPQAISAVEKKPSVTYRRRRQPPKPTAAPLPQTATANSCAAIEIGSAGTDVTITNNRLVIPCAFLHTSGTRVLVNGNDVIQYPPPNQSQGGGLNMPPISSQNVP